MKGGITILITIYNNIKLGVIDPTHKESKRFRHRIGRVRVHTIRVHYHRAVIRVGAREVRDCCFGEFNIPLKRMRVLAISSLLFD